MINHRDAEVKLLSIQYKSSRRITHNIYVKTYLRSHVIEYLILIVLTNSTLTGAPTDWMRLRMLLIVTRVMAVSARLWGNALWLTVGDSWWQVVRRAFIPLTVSHCGIPLTGFRQQGRLWNEIYLTWYKWAVMGYSNRPSNKPPLASYSELSNSYDNSYRPGRAIVHCRASATEYEGCKTIRTSCCNFWFGDYNRHSIWFHVAGYGNLF